MVHCRACLSQHERVCSTVYSPSSECARFPDNIVSCGLSPPVEWSFHMKPSISHFRDFAVIWMVA
jgi:hypothetical protein